MWCDITVRSNIVGTASSFSFNLSENPKWNCALFVNESAVKWSEQRTEFLLMWSGTSLKIKFIHSFLTLGSEGRHCTDCFSINLALHSVFLSSEPSLSFWFLHRPVIASLIIYTAHTNRWAGLNRQWCRSRRWSSSAEVVFSHTIIS